MVDNNISEGHTVEILESDYLLHRYPHLIGTLGTIIHSPEHPNTWYTVSIPSAQETIKLQATSIKLTNKTIKKQSPDVLSKVKESPKISTMNAPSPKFSPASRPRSNSYTSSIKEFKVGSKVVIIETDNVSQRAPQLIGEVGIIREVPVHPATWFKVEFSDHQIVTFRPSAFKAVGDNDSDCGSVSDLHSVTKRERSFSFPDSEVSVTKHSNKRYAMEDEDNDLSEHLLDLDDNNNHESLNQQNDKTDSNSVNNGNSNQVAGSTKQVMLDTIDPELWTGTIVHILGGKCHDQRGEIMRSGNGWVQIITENKEEVAKRAHELIVIKIPSERVPRPNKDDLKRMKKAIAETKIIPLDSYNNAIDDRPKRVRKIPKSNNYLYNHPRYQYQLNSNYNTDFDTRGNYNNSYVINHENKFSNYIKISSPISYDKPKPFNPNDYGIQVLSNELIRQKRLLIEQYVNNQSNYLKNRPNLNYYLNEIKDNFIDSSIDSENNPLIAICSKCQLEIWSSTRQCWNEMCPASPVYWKLCGTTPISNKSNKIITTNDSSNNLTNDIITANTTSKNRSDSSMTDLEVSSPELLSSKNQPQLNSILSLNNFQSYLKYHTMTNANDAELLTAIYAQSQL